MMLPVAWGAGGAGAWGLAGRREGQEVGAMGGGGAASVPTGGEGVMQPELPCPLVSATPQQCSAFAHGL